MEVYVRKIRIDRSKLKRIMEKENFATVEELAEAAGLSPTTIYNAMDSYSWTAKTLSRLCDALHCRFEELLTEDLIRTQAAASGSTEDGVISPPMGARRVGPAWGEKEKATSSWR